MHTDLNMIAGNFQLEGKVAEVTPLGEGFINDTFIIKTEGNNPNYILQRKNKKIFSPIPAMMENIQKVCVHIKKKVEAAGGDPMREAMTVIPATDGKLYFLDDEDEYWAVSQFIDDTIAYGAAETPELAYAGGKGIGKFQSLVSDLNETLVNILPGFHDIRYRFNQWDEVLAKDPVGRKSEVAEEISWIESRREEMLDFWKLVENGTIPTRISHNDTKINNILFDKNGEVLCVIDLDTVKEFEYLAFSAKYITYEQVLRFLMDYIDGDNYYKTKSADHNLVRTRAQYKLLQSMEEQFDEMNKAVLQYSVL